MALQEARLDCEAFREMPDSHPVQGVFLRQELENNEVLRHQQQHRRRDRGKSDRTSTPTQNRTRLPHPLMRQRMRRVSERNGDDKVGR